MKRTFLTLLVMLMAVGFVSAQTLTTNDAVLVYYMPKTLLAFDVEYTQTTRTQGPFYQYAERYLGTKDIVMTNETVFELKRITIDTETLADKSRAFKFHPVYSQKANIVLNSKGMIESYNAEVQAEKKTSPFKDNRDKKRSEGKTVSKKSTIAPLSEEALFASSKAKMAEAAAKQIYRIRETRMNLLSGEVEHMPADSRMLEKMLEELDKQEEELVALFVGTTKIQSHNERILRAPTEDEKGVVILRFSKFSGVVGADDMSGEPIMVSIKTTKKQLAEPEDKKEKAKPFSEIYYNIPGEATVKVSDSKGRLLVGKTLPIAQFGVSIPLPMDLIKRKPHILFDTNTGAIQSISE